MIERLSSLVAELTGSGSLIWEVVFLESAVGFGVSVKSKPICLCLGDRRLLSALPPPLPSFLPKTADCAGTETLRCSDAFLVFFILLFIKTYVIKRSAAAAAAAAGKDRAMNGKVNGHHT
jgi:hypothetical protein